MKYQLKIRKDIKSERRTGPGPGQELDNYTFLPLIAAGAIKLLPLV